LRSRRLIPALALAGALASGGTVASAMTGV
jgi:hypothetical protein